MLVHNARARGPQDLVGGVYNHPWGPMGPLRVDKSLVWPFTWFAYGVAAHTDRLQMDAGSVGSSPGRGVPCHAALREAGILQVVMRMVVSEKHHPTPPNFDDSRSSATSTVGLQLCRITFKKLTTVAQVSFCETEAVNPARDDFPFIRCSYLASAEGLSRSFAQAWTAAREENHNA